LAYRRFCSLFILFRKPEGTRVTLSGRFQFLGDCYTFAAFFKKRAGFPPSRERRKGRGNDGRGAGTTEGARERRKGRGNDGRGAGTTEGARMTSLSCILQSKRTVWTNRNGFTGVGFLERVPERKNEVLKVKARGEKSISWGCRRGTGTCVPCR